MDGNFVGSTPSSITVAAGQHDIAVTTDRYMPARRFGLSVRVEDQTLTPVEVLNPNPKDLVRPHSGILR
jgi:hypothetical protein